MRFKKLFLITAGLLLLSACDMRVTNEANCFDSKSSCFPEDKNRPRVIHSLPAPETPIKTLRQLEVTFSESVKGALSASAYELQAAGTTPVIDKIEHIGGNSYLLAFSNADSFSSLTISFTGITDYNENPVIGTLTYEPDNTPPSFVESIPDDGGMLGEVSPIKVVFDEAINPAYTDFADSNNNAVTFSKETTYKTDDTLVIEPESGTWNHGGDYTIDVTELKATDNGDNAMTTGITLSLTINQPPTPSWTGEIFHADDGTTTALDATASSDPDGDTLSCTWSETTAHGVSITPSGTGNCLATLEYDFSSESYDTAVKQATIQVSVSDGTNPGQTSSRGVRIYRTDFAYVKAGATGDGSAPDNALGLIYGGSTGAMTYAENNSKIAVAVSAGQYEQWQGTDNPNNHKAVYLKEGINLLGGYDQTTWSRDIYANISYIQKREYVTQSTDPFVTDNYRVMVCNGVNETAVVDGFTIENHGGTMFFYGIEVINSDCTIRNNRINSGGYYSSTTVGQIPGNIESTPVFIRGTSMPRVINNTMYIKGIKGKTTNSSYGVYRGTAKAFLFALKDANSKLIAINNTMHTVDAAWDAASDGFALYRFIHNVHNSGSIEVFQNNIVQIDDAGSCNFNVNTSYYKNNVFHGCTPPAGGSDNIVTDPVLDTSGTRSTGVGFDYQLQSTSPCSVTQGGLDLSGGLSSPVTIPGFNKDRFGNDRTTSNGGWSIGAHEYDGSCQ